MPIQERETFYNLKVTYPDGTINTKDFVYKSEKQYKDIVESEGGKQAVVEILKGQSFIITTAENKQDFEQLVPNETVQLNYSNYGFKLAQQNFRGRYMRDEDQPAVEGDIDLASQPEVQEERVPRVKDPMAPMRRELKNAFAKEHPGAPMPSDEQINTMLESIFKNQFSAIASALAAQQPSAAETVSQ